ncbi:ligase-associated DNA damage response DEXH box helicase [Neolewinella agarilytica]|uniref:ligase-associated DNA damage response DEXH box helicase n=1 Tax=Neolewinella agarilytica TaxID=478744 RepID=UPI001C311F6D|nr:ligase-associated DNA damage response DEXH box helicase [Neolewinella agarilytica]
MSSSTNISAADSAVLARGSDWFHQQGWEVFPFQQQSWEAYLAGKSGLVNAPTGSGKTYSLIIPILLEYLAEQQKNGGAAAGAGEGTSSKAGKIGLRAIWITPIRALTREIQQAAQRAADDLGVSWRIDIRSGDTPTAERTKQRKNPPQILITTPESLHLLLSSKGYEDYFSNLRCLVADEWHELMGTKRGVLLELALSRIRALRKTDFKTWGISATIGNMQEAADVLHGQPATCPPQPATPNLQPATPNLQPATCNLLPATPNLPPAIIRAETKKETEIITVMPDTIETFPWAGHLGIKLLEKVLPIIHSSGSTLIFTNTRVQCEIWYQRLLEADPDLSGQIAMHHGSIDRKLRDWVEDALHEGTLKAVVCTASLDLGVDFRPVETIVQIGSPKGVARFLQRAGRSGHRPGAKSVIHFVPTNSLELLEASALRRCIEEGRIEQRMPFIRSFDVLIQYLVTLAVGGGFRPKETLAEIRQTFSFSSVSDEEFSWCLDFITTGGNSLGAYDEYHKVVEEDGLYKVVSKRVAMMHRLSIGAIVSGQVLMLKFITGARIGTIDEYFVSTLNTGDTFFFGGRSLKLVKVKGTDVLVRRSRAKKGKIPSWHGGTLPLSSQLSIGLRDVLDDLKRGNYRDAELEKLAPLGEVQARRSAIPARDELLVEYFQDKEGYHLLMYPCEGRGIHEGLANLIAWRIGQFAPMTFTVASNDYGFEILSDQPIPIEEALGSDLFNTNELEADLNQGINTAEMAGRRFRDIAAIAGLVFKGYPGKKKKEKHLQSSSRLFFEVFTDYEPDNLLLLQAYDETLTFQLQEARMRAALDRINGQKIVFTRPPKATPFSFSLIVDRMRQRVSSEKLTDRIKRMRLAVVRD